jgi:hypothetical protein
MYKVLEIVERSKFKILELETGIIHITKAGIIDPILKVGAILSGFNARYIEHTIHPEVPVVPTIITPVVVPEPVTTPEPEPVKEELVSKAINISELAHEPAPEVVEEPVAISEPETVVDTESEEGSSEEASELSTPKSKRSKSKK